MHTIKTLWSLTFCFMCILVQAKFLLETKSRFNKESQHLMSTEFNDRDIEAFVATEKNENIALDDDESDDLYSLFRFESSAGNKEVKKKKQENEIYRFSTETEKKFQDEIKNVQLPVAESAFEDESETIAALMKSNCEKCQDGKLSSFEHLVDDVIYVENKILEKSEALITAVQNKSECPKTSESDWNLPIENEEFFEVKGYESSTNSYQSKSKNKLHLKIGDTLDGLDELVDSTEDDLVDLNTHFRSFVFNPGAQPSEKFQKCTTPKNESGYCRYVQHCLLPSLLSSLNTFVQNVCIIEEKYVGVCCPEFPVSTVSVIWPTNSGNASNKIASPALFSIECGIGASTRVVGGSNANIKAWPWMVALLSNGNFFCGGALINNRYVLTAAHCTYGVRANQIVARLGEHDFDKNSSFEDNYFVTEIKRHGLYTRLQLRNDIALLKLDRPAIFSEYVQSICLPDVNQSYLGKNATLAGWGNTNGTSDISSHVLQEASFPVVENIQCAKTHGLPIPESLVCASAPLNDKGACNGDSGGPLMFLDEDEHWKVIGVVSWGRLGCSPTFPTVYTRVTHYLKWIVEHAS